MPALSGKKAGKSGSRSGQNENISIAIAAENHPAAADGVRVTRISSAARDTRRSD